MRGGLLSQGLFLVVVPVSLQIAFVIVLSGLLQEAERDIVDEYHDKMVVASAHQLISRFYEWGALIKLYYSTRDDMVLEKHSNSKLMILKDLRALQKLVANHPEEEARLQDVTKSTNRAIAAGERYLAVFQQTGYSRGTGPEMELSLAELLRSINYFIQAEESEAKKAPNEKARSREAVVIFLYAGCFGILLIGAGLAVYFIKSSTVRRLRTLVENSKRLAANESLLAPVKGTDEIAHLDKVFHEMADELHAAARHKQELMQMVSHDLRTPLSSVQMSLSTLVEGTYGSLPDQAIKQLRLCEFNTTRLIHMIRDLLDIERLEAGKLEMNFDDVSLAEIINQSVTAVQAYAERKDIVIEAHETTARIYADGDRLVQVLINLLSNAVKFSEKNRPIKILVEESIAWTEIRVTDKGRGIPGDSLKSVFDRFHQVQKEDAAKHQGSGLGLAIAKAIVVAHNGEIGVDSVEGEGSSFWIRIPSEKPPS